MTYEFAFAAIAAFSGIIAATGTFFNGLAAINVSRSQRHVASKISELSTSVVDIKTQTNHMKDALVELTDKEAHARGMFDQRTETRDAAASVVAMNKP